MSEYLDYPTVAQPSPWASRLILAAGVGILASLLSTIGVFLDWISIRAVFVGELGMRGLDSSDGKIALVLALAAGIACAIAAASRARGWFILVGILGAVLAVVAVYDGRDIQERVAEVNAEAEGFGIASVGSGIYLVGLGGVLLVLAAILGITRSRS